MLGIAIDALTLIVLLKVISDEEVGFGQACLIALVSSIGIAVLAGVLAEVMGILGIILAALIAAALLGAALSWLFGAEIKRACITAGIFMFVHLGFAIGVGLLMR